jgi:Tfp pilus assembly protein PilV
MFKRKFTKKYTQQGAAITELLIAIAVFTIGMFTLALFMIDILKSTQRVQDINQAVLIAQEGIEAVQSIRDDSFNTIYNAETDPYGLERVGSSWTLDNDPGYDTTTPNSSKSFNRSVYISTVDDLSGDAATNTVMLIRSEVWWESFGGTSTTTLQTYLTNWER